jgi:hypothetical protein
LRRVVVVCFALLGATRASAEIFHSRESALALAFPGADSVVARDLLLSEKEAEGVRQVARVDLESRFATVYVGYRDGLLLGYAFLDTHDVRTLPETLLVVLHPQGTVKAVHVLAFHEPSEYLPSPRWLGQFDGRALSDELWLGRGVAGIAGSTLSVSAATAAVRRLLAIHRIKIASSGEPSVIP